MYDASVLLCSIMDDRVCVMRLRKNWLFSQTAKGASASADMYSLVETAKANSLDVFEYLSWLFRQITAATHNFTDEFLEKLMPWNEQAQENC